MIRARSDTGAPFGDRKRYIGQNRAILFQLRKKQRKEVNKKMTMQLKKRLSCLLPVLLALQLGCAFAAAEQTTDYPQCGLRIHYDEQYPQPGLYLDGSGKDIQGHPVYSISFRYAPALAPLFKELAGLGENATTPETEAELFDQINTHMKCLLYIVLLPQEEYSEKIHQRKSLEDLSGIPGTLLLGENCGHTYLHALPAFETDGMSPEEATQYEACKAYMPQLVKQVEWIPLAQQTGSETIKKGALPFTTTDLDGNPVDESIFAQSDLTVLNVWGTFCSPCIGEIPELGEWARALPANVRLYGLVSDITSLNDTDQIALAKKIMQKANADYRNLIADESLLPLLDGVVGVPTTFFIDRNGNLVGDPVVGADVAQCQKTVEDYLHAQT